MTRKNNNIISLLLSSVFLVFMFSFLSQGTISAEETVMIVNQHNNVVELTLRDLERLYKGNKKKWDNGESVELFLPVPGSDEMKKMLVNVFRMKSEADVAKFYLKSIFQQKFTAIPGSVSGQVDAIKQISRRPGGIAPANSAGIEDYKAPVKALEVDGLNEG